MHNAIRAGGEEVIPTDSTLGEVLWEKPVQLYADAAYDTEPIRSGLNSMCIEPNVPYTHRNGRKFKPYNVELYRKRGSAVERFFGRLKSFSEGNLRYVLS